MKGQAFMTRVTVDTQTLSRLQGPGPLEVCDEAGQVLGYFYPMPPAGSVRSPISDEELERRRQQPGGQPLSEILKQLGQ